MTLAPEAPAGRSQAAAAQFLAGQSTGIEGREEDYLRAMQLALRTTRHTKGYPHEMNDALIMEYLTGVRFARRLGVVDQFNAEHVEVMAPVLDRVRGVIEDTGEREIALEAMAGWSTCHYQLVLTETHKEPGKRWFLSPFKTGLEQGRRVGQFDFDEDYVVTETFLPRFHGYAERLGVELKTGWDPQTRIITLELVD